MDSQRENIQLGTGRSFRLLRWDRSVTHVEVVQGPGEAVPIIGQGDHWHYHRATELTLIQRGAGTRFVADHIELFESGDLVLIGSNVPHYWHQRSESRGLALQWDFPLEHGLWAVAEAAPLLQLEQAARHGLAIRGETARVIRAGMERIGDTTGLRRFALFLEILADFTTAPERNLRRLARQPFSLSGTAGQRDAIGRAVSYILANYREPLALGTILDLVNMSRATFARQFQRHAGKSFSTFVNQVRLQAVCHAMRDTSDPIGTIALNHGFNNLSFFNRLFRREFGCNPTTYRTGLQPRSREDEAKPEAEG